MEKGASFGMVHKTAILDTPARALFHKSMSFRGMNSSTDRAKGSQRTFFFQKKTFGVRGFRGSGLGWPKKNGLTHGSKKKNLIKKKKNFKTKKR
jgi:hypothetical protein